MHIYSAYDVLPCDSQGSSSHMFVANRRIIKDSSHLSGVQQNEGESIKEYFHKFSTEAHQILGVDLELVLLEGLCLGPFYSSIMQETYADHVVDIHLVNADGEILDRETMGEDLFWALRGGGAASFGVILAYKIKLVQVPPKVTVLSKTLTLPQGATKAVAKWQRVAYSADNRLYINAGLIVSNKSVQADFSGLFLGELPELLLIMEQSLPELKVARKDCKEMTWIESAVVFSSFPVMNINSSQPLSVLLNRSPVAPNISFKVKSDIVTEPILEQSWEKIWKYILNGGEQLVMLVEPLGGKVAEIAETETPFPHRNGSKFVIQYIMVWSRIGKDEAKKHIEFLRGFYKFMAPFVSKKPRAAYLNFRDLDLGRNTEGVIRYNKAKVWGSKYYSVNFKRLAYAKSKTDPDDFFKNEQSIPPLFY
ncbi:berberine bridge enzyme-like 23 [Phalaenopsis equestris]|uniref:berberine bridge enzyme-like 23 n=1 Tax=Phalaenopsis equestris TaxID=78828 RepID=UPI0009E2815A|nr:berberine bridge enzyme-like 23 [Phalaenopsis equestris]